jgi:hypothetical protein
MTLHAAMLAQHVQKLANGDAHAIVGDFNLKVGDPAYTLLTTGQVRITTMCLRR